MNTLSNNIEKTYKLSDKEKADKIQSVLLTRETFFSVKSDFVWRFVALFNDRYLNESTKRKKEIRSLLRNLDRHLRGVMREMSKSLFVWETMNVCWWKVHVNSETVINEWIASYTVDTESRDIEYMGMLARDSANDLQKVITAMWLEDNQATQQWIWSLAKMSDILLEESEWDMSDFSGLSFLQETGDDFEPS